MREVEGANTREWEGLGCPNVAGATVDLALTWRNARSVARCAQTRFR